MREKMKTSARELALYGYVYGSLIASVALVMGDEFGFSIPSAVNSIAYCLTVAAIMGLTFGALGVWREKHAS